MKRGFVLISTLALIVILSFLVLVLSRTIYNDTLKTTIYANSIEKRIEIINYESFLVDLLIDNSVLNKNLNLAEQEINLTLVGSSADVDINQMSGTCPQGVSTCNGIITLDIDSENANIQINQKDAANDS